MPNTKWTYKSIFWGGQHRRAAIAYVRRRRALLPGAHLARLELAEALAVMTERMPKPRRTGPTPWKPLTALSGPTTLSIELEQISNLAPTRLTSCTKLRRVD
jgi:hypothetical protein